MVRLLRVRNFGVMEEVEIELGAGLTVVTGETGAGKSMLIDALVLISGGRADASLVRSGCDEAVVEAVLEPTSELLARLEASGLPGGSMPGGGGEVLVRRVVQLSGRGRAHINGSLVTLALLQQVMRGLFDIAGQLEHASLFDEDNHLALVDRFAGVDGEDGPRRRYLASFEQRRDLASQLASLGGDEREVQSRGDFLRFQLSELRAADPHEGDEGRLEQRRRKLAAASRLASLARSAEEAMASREGAASDLMGEAARHLLEIEKVDPTIAHVKERLAAARAELDEAVRLLSRYEGGLEPDPARLAELDEKLDTLKRLARKHGVQPDALGGRLVALADELELLERRGERRAELERQAALVEAALAAHARGLSEARLKAVTTLEAAVSRCLSRLSLKNARFQVELSAAATPLPTGADQVRFLFSANLGEPPKPLAKVASGGEASRIMLAIKAALGGSEQVAVSVLDEVDTGVSGAVADVVGRLIKDISQHRQVLCVTHLPQVAAHADRHLQIEKRLAAGRTHSFVKVLSGSEARSLELARMLSGVEVSREARAAAQVLLRAAGAARGPKGLNAHRRIA